ncbi:DUF1428 domain-containing protein [Sulfitobacter sp. 1A10445]|uniref:DUF1428 domain-containing protein n=1 Tax=unclassified Sulfitobacter TaxID=196795 RepID=UPI003745F834
MTNLPHNASFHPDERISPSNRVIKYLEMEEAWGAYISEGEYSDFKSAVALNEDETVCFSWIIWPDKEAHDKCGASMQSDPRWQGMDMPFDGKRMMWGGFAPIVAEKA